MANAQTVCAAGERSKSQASSPLSRSVQSQTHQHRSFATDTEEADKIKYPVTAPDHVFTYKGPLALTVSRLKVIFVRICATTCNVALSKS